MDTETEGKLDTFGLFQMGMQVFHLIKDSQARPYGSLSVIFVSLGIAKIHQQSIP